MDKTNIDKYWENQKAIYKTESEILSQINHPKIGNEIEIRYRIIGVIDEHISQR